MILGNRTNTPRAIRFGEEYITVPPMGFVTIEDNATNKELMDKLKQTHMFKMLLNGTILTLNEKVTEYTKETKVEGPQPPAELVAEPTHPRVTRGKAKKTKETMKV